MRPTDWTKPKGTCSTERQCGPIRERHSFDSHVPNSNDEIVWPEVAGCCLNPHQQSMVNSRDKNWWFLVWKEFMWVVLFVLWSVTKPNFHQNWFDASRIRRRLKNRAVVVLFDQQNTKVPTPSSITVARKKSDRVSRCRGCTCCECHTEKSHKHLTEPFPSCGQSWTRMYKPGAASGSRSEYSPVIHDIGHLQRKY